MPFKHMSFWGPFLTLNLAMYHLIVGVHSRKVIIEGTHLSDVIRPTYHQTFLIHGFKVYGPCILTLLK